MPRKTSWYLDHRLLLELFALVNFAFLAPDIYIAHSMNSFRHSAEWIPFYFSLAAPVVLLVALVSNERLWRVLGHLVGWAAVVVGVAGMVLHLESQFFQQRTLASLVYTAPFVAPLSYAGVGLLLIMNRMVDAESVEWPYWVLLLAQAGFFGNFILSLADHAQNGFFYWTEWIPVVSSALVVGFLLVPFLIQVDRSYVPLCAAVVLLQMGVGLLGFYYHVAADLRGRSPDMFANFVHGAPAMAPLLFPNLSLLTFLGLWRLWHHLPVAAETASKASGACQRPGE
jgi:hypothetical protein